MQENDRLWAERQKQISESEAKKWNKYAGAKPEVNDEMRQKVDLAIRGHYEELSRLWQSTRGRRRMEIVSTFTNELKKENPTEYRELFSGKLHRPLADFYLPKITVAYGLGYMYFKGWITLGEMQNANLHLGLALETALREISSSVESNGIAFGRAFMRISALGTAAAVNAR